MDNKTFLELAAEIAKNITGWKLNTKGDSEGRTWCCLVPDDTQTFSPWKGQKGIWLHNDEYHHKMSLSGCYPVGKDNARYSPRNPPSIGCSVKRDAAKIAADIMRRFIPDYLASYDASVADKIKTEAAMDAKTGAATRLAKIVGKEVPSNGSLHFYFDPVYGNIDVNHGGETGTLTIHGNVGLIEAALHALKQAGGFRK